MPLESRVSFAEMEVDGMQPTYLGRANVFPRTPNAARLDPALGMDPLVPCRLDELLYLEYGRYAVAQALVALELGAYYVRRHHLYIPVAAEAPWGSPR